MERFLFLWYNIRMFAWYILVFLFGLIIGSFLNVVIYRLEKGGSALKGRSYCPHCKHTLSWRDLIPVASFLLLGGKCRYCKKSISLQYPLVELGTACVFVLSFLAVRDLAQGSLAVPQPDNFLIFQTFYLFVIASLLIVLFVYDLRHYILPDKILFPAIGLALLWDLLVLRSLGEGGGFVVSGFAAVLFFFSIFALSKGRAMGFGDVKLAFFMGLFLGWPNILVAFFTAFLAGAFTGVALIALKKKGMKSEIPFGPFLIGGTLIALLAGKQIVDWYLRLVLV